MASSTRVERAKRLFYSVVAFAAGEAVLLCFLLADALHLKAMLVAAHMGEPGTQLSSAMYTFVFLTAFAFIAWLLVGVPVALFCGTALIACLTWPVRLLISFSLGPLGVVLVLLTLSVHIPSLFSQPRIVLLYSPFALLVSVPAFLIYAALLRRDLARQASAGPLGIEAIG